MNDRMVLRGFLANVGVIPPLIFTFQANPTSIRDNKAVNYADRRSRLGGASPGKQYMSGGARTISFTIMIDGLERGLNVLNPTPLDNGISSELAKLRSFLYPKTDAWAIMPSLPGSDAQGKRIESPPTCHFGFGTRILECVVTAIHIEETLFNSMLAPVRATADITLDVIEEPGAALYEADKQHRNMLALLGIQNILPF